MADHVIIVAGDQGSGKTTFLSDVVGLVSERIIVGGVLAKGTWQGAERDSFTLEDVGRGRSLLFCQCTPVSGWERIRRFYVNPAGQEFGEQALSEENLGASRLVVIDEVGPFELQGKGWTGPLQRLSRKKGIILLLAVRRALVGEVIRHWGFDGVTLFDAAVDGPRDCARRIIALLDQSL